MRVLTHAGTWAADRILGCALMRFPFCNVPRVTTMSDSLVAVIYVPERLLLERLMVAKKTDRSKPDLSFLPMSDVNKRHIRIKTTHEAEPLMIWL